MIDSVVEKMGRMEAEWSIVLGRRPGLPSFTQNRIPGREHLGSGDPSSAPH